MIRVRPMALCRMATLAGFLCFIAQIAHGALLNEQLFQLLASQSTTDTNGKSVSLFSHEACQAEFRYLRDVLHRIDLNGPPILTDGWTTNIAETEWPFMSMAYLGYACINLAQSDPAFREEAFKEARWLIEALQRPRMSGFVTPHFGPPFGQPIKTPSVFVHGHFLNLAIRYREVSGDKRFDPIIHSVAEALAKAFSNSSQGILKSYDTMWWLPDNFPALSALRRYDLVYQKNLSVVTTRSVASTKKYYLDSSGLFSTYVDPQKNEILQGARGISVMYGLHFLRDFDPDFSQQQYELAKRLLVRTLLGHAAVKEYPDGANVGGDIDSGPLILSFGPSASGFGIAAASLNGDKDTAAKLIRAAQLAGLPTMQDGKLSYAMMPLVGQAVILFGKSTMLKPKP